jgi:putative ABC transport system permease protein
VDALASLGFATAAGPVQPVAADEPGLAVVGWLTADPPLDFLNRALLTVADSDEAVIRIIVLAESTEDVRRLADAVRAVLDPTDPTSVAVQTSEALLQVRAAVRGELGTWGRNLVTLVLGAGLVLTALNVFGAVTARRRDFGRRRALGASRFDIVVLVTVQTVATALAGAVVGVGIGMLVVHQLVGTSPHLDFGVAVAVLAIIATAIAAMPPAVVAAFRDPVRILRVP